jgi:hypothetical protein
MYTANSNDITSAAECDDSSMLVLRNWGGGMPVTLSPQLLFATGHKLHYHPKISPFIYFITKCIY